MKTVVKTSLILTILVSSWAAGAVVIPQTAEVPIGLALVTNTEYFPDVAVGSNGRYHFMSRGPDAAMYHLSFFSGTWSTAHMIAGDYNTSPRKFTLPQVAVGPDSLVHAVWGPGSFDANTLYYVKSTNQEGSSWGGVEKIQDGGWAEGCAVAVDTSDTAHVIAAGIPSGGFPSFGHYKKTLGGVWVGPTVLDPVQAEAKLPRAVADSLGNVHLAWRFGKLHYKKYNGSSWGSPYQGTNGASAGDVDIAVNTAGKPYIISAPWTDTPTWYPTNQTAFTNASGSWADQTLMSTNYTTTNYTTDTGKGRIAFDNTGKGFAVWSKKVGGSNRVFFSYFNGSNWQTVEQVSVSGGQQTHAVVAAHNGQALVVWKDTRGDYYSKLLGPEATPTTTPTGTTATATPTSTPTHTPTLTPTGKYWLGWYSADTGLRPSEEGPTVWQFLTNGGDEMLDTEVEGGILTVHEQWDRHLWWKGLDYNPDPLAGSTIIMRMRILHPGTNPYDYFTAMNVSDNQNKEKMLWDKNLGVMSFEKIRDWYGWDLVPPRGSATVDATQWHIYRITILDARLKLYIDENATPAVDEDMVDFRPGHYFVWGNENWSGYDGTSDMEWDWVGHTIDGAWAPGAGPALTPVPTPTPTQIGAKGDMEPDGDWDLFDILRLVDIVLDVPPPPSVYETWAGDMDDDGDHDLFDILALVDKVLEE